MQATFWQTKRQRQQQQQQRRKLTRVTSTHSHMILSRAVPTQNQLTQRMKWKWRQRLQLCAYAYVRVCMSVCGFQCVFMAFALSTVFGSPALGSLKSTQNETGMKREGKRVCCATCAGILGLLTEIFQFTCIVYKQKLLITKHLKKDKKRSLKWARKNFKTEIKKFNFTNKRELSRDTTVLVRILTGFLVYVLNSIKGAGKYRHLLLIGC